MKRPASDNEYIFRAFFTWKTCINTIPKDHKRKCTVLCHKHKDSNKIGLGVYCDFSQLTFRGH